MTTVKRVAQILAIALFVPLPVSAQVFGARCDGFPPKDHRLEPRGDVVGSVNGPCVGQLFPVISTPDRDGEAAAIQSLTVERPARQGKFVMTGLREFRYQPSRTIKGWDTVVLRLKYTIPTGRLVSKPVYLRVTSDTEYVRMKQAGTLD